MAKSSAAERARLKRIVNKQKLRIRRRFEQFMKILASREAFRQVRRELERGDVEAALRFVDEQIASFSTAIGRAYVDAGEEGSQDIARALGKIRPAVAISFDVGNPRAAQFIRADRLRLIREMSNQQRATIRIALTESVELGENPIAAARRFQSAIGLTARQHAAVSTYRRLLEDSSGASLEALTRGLRDRRFDGTVRRSANLEEPLSKAQIDRMVDRYRQRYVAFRAETIARTESTRAVSAAREEALVQAVEELQIDPATVVRRWNTTQDGRERDTHAELDGQEVGMTEQFQSPSGARALQPGAFGVAAEDVQCRCVVTVSFEDRQ